LWLTDDQVAAYIDDDVYRLLMTLMLADRGGWNLFDPPTLAAMYEKHALYSATSLAHPRSELAHIS